MHCLRKGPCGSDPPGRGLIVFQLGEMMGEALARRVVGGGAASHIIGSFDKILIAETAVRGTDLVGRTVAELELPLRVGVNVIGIWDRSGFSIARPDTQIEFNTVMMLSGTREQLEAFDLAFMHMQEGQEASRVIVVGGGRVGIATAAFLARLGVDYRIIELEEKEVEPLGDKAVHGNAAHFHVLQKAGIIEAESIVITSNNDEIDIYLTIFCRKLRPDIQIISRATEPESVSKLHRAGADIVMSYASMGSNQILNYLQKSDTLMVAEGLSLFRSRAPGKHLGKQLDPAIIARVNRVQCRGSHPGRRHANPHRSKATVGRQRRTAADRGPGIRGTVLPTFPSEKGLSSTALHHSHTDAATLIPSAIPKLLQFVEPPRISVPLDSLASQTQALFSHQPWCLSKPIQTAGGYSKKSSSRPASPQEAKMPRKKHS
jgi:Trk K+ transport system NAD-binding subunit